MTQRSRSIGIVLALAYALCSVQATFCGAPTLLSDGWQIETEPTTAVFGIRKLCAVLYKIVGANINVCSLFAVRHERPAAKVYHAGKDERAKDLLYTTYTFDTSTLHDIRSTSKSVMSSPWGIMQRQGRTLPFDTPMLSLSPALAESNRGGREAITLSQVLSMSGGLAWSERRARSLSNNDEFGLFWHSSQAHRVFDRPMAVPVGTQFNYSGGNTAALVLLLVERAGMSVPEYTRQ